MLGFWYPIRLYFFQISLGITMNPLAAIGRLFLNFVASTGKIGLFFYRSIYHGFQPPYYWGQIVNQFVQIGYYSLPVVGMTAIFTGMVLALQSYTGFSRFSAEGAVATVVVLSITRELGPVLAGLMVAGRVGASMAAEIGTMRVTEQIDALFTLSANPFKYLIFPRIFAGAMVLPILVFISDLIGVLGGYLIGVHELGFNGGNYMQQTLRYLEKSDVNSGLIKAAVFGLIISLMGCYQGYNSERGAEGVGRATTNAVVSASIFILFMNYVLTSILFQR